MPALFLRFLGLLLLSRVCSFYRRRRGDRLGHLRLLLLRLDVLVSAESHAAQYNNHNQDHDHRVGGRHGGALVLNRQILTAAPAG